MKIREISIKYGSKKKKVKTNQLLLFHQLEQLEASLHLDPDNVVLQTSVKEKHVQIDEINKVEAEGAANAIGVGRGGLGGYQSCRKVRAVRALLV